MGQLRDASASRAALLSVPGNEDACHEHAVFMRSAPDEMSFTDPILHTWTLQTGIRSPAMRPEVMDFKWYPVYERMTRGADMAEALRRDEPAALTTW